MLKTVAVTLFCLFTVATLSVVRADTPLEISMKHIAKAYHQLTSDLKAPQDTSKDDYVALATTMKTEAQKARALVPQKAAELPADQQAAMVTAYQKSMDDFSASIDVLIKDLTASQWTAASNDLATLKMEESDGHKAFRKEEKKDGAAPAPAMATPPAAAVPTPASSSEPTNAPAPAAPGPMGN